MTFDWPDTQRQYQTTWKGSSMSDTDTTYKNYETWAVGMYLDGNYDGPAGIFSGGQNHQRPHVADALREWVEENVQPHSYDDDHPDPQMHPLVSDLLGAALGSVDWYELADAWIENVAEQVEA